MTKVYFPRALLPLAAVLVPMVDLLVGLPVLIVLMWLYETWPGGPEVLLAPVFLRSRWSPRSAPAFSSPRSTSGTATCAT